MTSGVESIFEINSSDELVHPYMSLYDPILDPTITIIDDDEESFAEDLVDQDDTSRPIRTSHLQKYPVHYATRIYDVLSKDTTSSCTTAIRSATPDVAKPQDISPAEENPSKVLPIENPPLQRTEQERDDSQRNSSRRIAAKKRKKKRKKRDKEKGISSKEVSSTEGKESRFRDENPSSQSSIISDESEHGKSVSTESTSRKDNPKSTSTEQPDEKTNSPTSERPFKKPRSTSDAVSKNQGTNDTSVNISKIHETSGISGTVSNTPEKPISPDTPLRKIKEETCKIGKHHHMSRRTPQVVPKIKVFSLNSSDSDGDDSAKPSASLETNSGNGGDGDKKKNAKPKKKKEKLRRKRKKRSTSSSVSGDESHRNADDRDDKDATVSTLPTNSSRTRAERAKNDGDNDSQNDGQKSLESFTRRYPKRKRVSSWGLTWVGAGEEEKQNDSNNDIASDEGSSESASDIESDIESDSDSEVEYIYKSRTNAKTSKPTEIKTTRRKYPQTPVKVLYPNGKYPNVDYGKIAKEKPNEDYSKDVVTDNGLFKDRQWNDTFRKLLAFYRKHGHTNAPRNPIHKLDHLNRFVQSQRAAFNLKILHPDRFRRLNSINVDWNPHEGRLTWDERFEQLVAYKEEYGHANIPKRYKENPTLGQWCRHQRALYFYERYKIKPYQIRALESIGFRWDAAMINWKKRFNELKEFKKEYGHFDVPKDYPNRLARWVQLRREEYARNSIPDEEEIMLDTLQFDWSIPEERTKANLQKKKKSASVD